MLPENQNISCKREISKSVASHRALWVVGVSPETRGRPPASNSNCGGHGARQRQVAHARRWSYIHTLIRGWRHNSLVAVTERRVLLHATMSLHISTPCELFGKLGINPTNGFGGASRRNGTPLNNCVKSRLPTTSSCQTMLSAVDAIMRHPSPCSWTSTASHVCDASADVTVSDDCVGHYFFRTKARRRSQPETLWHLPRLNARIDTRRIITERLSRSHQWRSVFSRDANEENSLQEHQLHGARVVNSTMKGYHAPHDDTFHHSTQPEMCTAVLQDSSHCTPLEPPQPPPKTFSVGRTTSLWTDTGLVRTRITFALCQALYTPASAGVQIVHQFGTSFLAATSPSTVLEVSTLADDTGSWERDAPGNSP